jgi:hypothetical protein
MVLRIQGRIGCEEARLSFFVCVGGPWICQDMRNLEKALGNFSKINDT